MGMTFAGVDGCAKGWFVVAFPDLGEPSFGVFPDAGALRREHAGAELICIDVPIGLRDEGDRERVCDTEARNLLGERASSVFPVPCREAVYAATYRKACDINEHLAGKRLSKQTWGIVPRIRQVDELLLGDEAARARFREVHPELCFWALAGGRPMRYPKRTEQGYLERANVLEFVHPGAYDIIARALDAFPRSAVARDDVLDALSAAVTALAGPGNLATIPVHPETDARGLPMQMVYSPQFLEHEWV
jgi:predicted RNase H-like nuclease